MMCSLWDTIVNDNYYSDEWWYNYYNNLVGGLELVGINGDLLVVNSDG
jgi:hypothetical protein